VDVRRRIAVVTGGASGIGRELVMQLAEQGAHVAVCDINQRRLDTVVRGARAVNPDVRVSGHVVDVTDEAAVGQLATDVARAHASDAIHVLVNNAGVVGGGSFVTGPREEWERTFAVSWFGVYHCTRAFLPMLLAADRGAVVNVASVNALWASLGPGSSHTAYSSAKFAVRGFTESLISDFRANAPHLTAVLVLPGHVRTSMPAPPRSWHRALDSLFTDYQAVSSSRAATMILDAVREGRWRVVIGDDAQAVDERVRDDPWTAYD
jgi:NAD(P)-dependent dehydrogenase (short-subunit alcohol dehydrogenase family)